MADDPGGSRANSPPDHGEVDSVVADEVNSTPAMTRDAAREAMKAYQREAAKIFLARSLSHKDGAQDTDTDPPPDASADDGASEISHLTTKHIDDAQAKQFEKLKKKYLEKRKKGTLSIDEDIAFMKAQSAETARQRKMRQDAEFDDPFIAEEDGEGDEDDTLFLQDAVPDLPEFESDEEPQPKKGGRKNKRAAGDDATEVERPRKRAKKSQSSRKVCGQDYTDGDLKDVLSKKKKSKSDSKKSKKNAKQGPSMTDTRNLRGNDVFRDAALNADLPDQPTFSGDFSTNKGRREDAMKQLIASVPTESKDIAKMDRKYLENAIRDFSGAAGAVKASPDGNWLVRGMKTSLKHYQVLGVSFMRRRETGNDRPRGGIMADAMGLGKTLMSLANIVNGKPKGKGKLRTTLIVASPALLDQWSQEIQTHCLRESESPHGLGGIIRYKAKSEPDLEVLQKAEIILCSYQEVLKSYPKPEAPTGLTTAKQKDEWWQKHYEKEKGVLHRLSFLRIVLDEAQAIKNHLSRTSMACRALTAKHHWALTGTPILNGISEFYSTFKFLKEPHTGSFRIFKENFCDKTDPESTEKLNVFLRKLMVRRTHLDRLFGTKLLDLPKPSQTTMYLEFSEIERQIYEIVKNRMVTRINYIAKQEGSEGLKKKFHTIYTLILRLRQLCGSILLLQGTLLDILTREDFEKLNSMAESEEEMSDDGTALLIHLRRVLSTRSGMETREGEDGGTISETQILANSTVDIGDIEGDTGGKHGLSFRFKKYLRTLAKSEKWPEIVERSTCVTCRQPPENAYISECFHVYCLQCLTDMQHLAARRGHDSAKCVECGTHYTNARPCEGLEKLAEESIRSSPTEIESIFGKKKTQKTITDDDWIDMSGDVLPSAKTRAVKAQVLEWLKDKDAKIIVYTQFLPMVRILEKVCRGEKGWGYCKYTGAMSHDSRAAAIHEFRDDPKKRILLASLKAGGLGLNLTMACRVLIVDPWWNSAVEQQAFARVFRISQTRETELTRLVIRNTIDSAMMAIKKRKDEEINAVMDSANKKDSLTIEDLIRLFGEVREDGEGKPFIFAQGGDGEDGFDEEPDHLRLPHTDPEDENGFRGNDE